MSNYQFDTIVNRQEAEALKELIFKRARERAESMTQDSQEKYTSSVRNEIMDVARDSFVSDRNPFSMMRFEPAKQSAPQAPASKPAEQKPERLEIGFPQHRIEDIKAQIKYRNIEQNEQITKTEVDETMEEARAGFEKKTSFMGALDFLNSQATISLVSRKGTKFEAMA